MSDEQPVHVRRDWCADGLRYINDDTNTSRASWGVSGKYGTRLHTGTPI